MFISCGGLDSLVHFIDDANLYLRGQVLEILLSATDCDTFDWFKRPESNSDKALHQSLLVVGRSATFLQKLLANRVGSYPGGSFRSLQLIAFTLSWMRALYTADQKLQLSPKALSELTIWAEKSGAGKGPAPPPAEGEQEDPELQLARTLVEDFGGAQNNAPVASVDAVSATSAASCVLTAIDDSSLAVPMPQQSSAEPIGEKTVVNTATSDLPPPPPETTELSAVDLKEQGNRLFKAGKHEAAIDAYQSALDKALSPQQCDTAHTELVVSLHCNMATARWKLVQDLLVHSPELELDDADVTDSALLQRYRDIVQSCLDECRRALSLQPTCAKAAYRLACVLLLQRCPLEALQVTQACLDVIACSKCNNSPSGITTCENSSVVGGGSGDQAAASSSNVDLLLQIKRRCIAAVLLSQRDGLPVGASSLQGADLGLTPKTSDILKSLLVQYQIELELPAAGRCGVTASVDTAISGAEAPEAAKVLGGADVPKAKMSKVSKEVASEATANQSDATAPMTKEDKVKTKKRAVVDKKASTSSLAQRLQQIDDDMLESLMKRSSVKT